MNRLGLGTDNITHRTMVNKNIHDSEAENTGLFTQRFAFTLTRYI